MDVTGSLAGAWAYGENRVALGDVRGTGINGPVRVVLRGSPQVSSEW